MAAAPYHTHMLLTQHQFPIMPTCFGHHDSSMLLMSWQQYNIMPTCIWHHDTSTPSCPYASDTMTPVTYHAHVLPTLWHQYPITPTCIWHYDSSTPSHPPVLAWASADKTGTARIHLDIPLPGESGKYQDNIVTSVFFFDIFIWNVSMHWFISLIGA